MALILRTLELDGRLAKNAVSLSTIRRLYREHGLDRDTLKVSDGLVRLRWQADRVDALWHADVCHGPALRIAGRAHPLRIHAILDDHSRYIVAIAATTTEREVEMLSLLVKAFRSTERTPEALYLDNGATYTGDVLATACSRLGIGFAACDAARSTGARQDGAILCRVRDYAQFSRSSLCTAATGSRETPHNDRRSRRARAWARLELP